MVVRPQEEATGQTEMAIASREQQIRERAYAIWEGEGRPADRAEAHWLQAEAEIAHAPARSNGTAARAQKRPAAARKRDLSERPAAPKRRAKA